MKFLDKPLYSSACSYIQRLKNMDKPQIAKKVKRQTVIKTATSVLSGSLVLAIIMGMIGLIISQSLAGFLVGFCMSYVMSWILLASIIPFIGVWLQWQWSEGFSHFLINAVSFTPFQHSEFWNTAIYVPLIIYTIIGVIICVVVSIIAVVVIGAIIGAIVSGIKS